MVEDWRSQLQSEDPRVRVEAIKAIANSGDRANLPYLKEIVENDPDPRLQDYARKAARHLFTSTEKTAPEQATPQEKREPVQEKKPRSPEPEVLPPTSSVPPAGLTAAENKIQRALSLHMRGSPQKALKAFVQGLDLDPNLANETFTRSVASELTGLPSDQAIAILTDHEDRKELLNPPKEAAKKIAQELNTEASPEAKETSKSHNGLMKTWLSFFSMSEEFLADEADHANTEDTFLSILVFTIATVVISLITGFIQFQRIITWISQLEAQVGESLLPPDFNFGSIFLVMLITTLVMTPLSFFMASGLQYLGAKLFGGSGDFKSHLYLLALIQVPITVLGGLVSCLSYIPAIGFVAGLAGFGLLIFTLIITVRAIKAVHDISTGRAVASIFLPPFILVWSSAAC